MKKILVILSFFVLFCNAEDTNLIVKQKNALYIQNLIESEEKIALQYERYLLSEFKIPTIETLIDNKYLGKNFSKRNHMSINKLIEFIDASNLKIKFAIQNTQKDYLLAFYERDLYRDRTSVKIVKTPKGLIDVSFSYVRITLKSLEAKTIHSILLDNKTILKSCETDDKINKYCSKNAKTIRWHYTDSSWIEYSKKDFNLGNVTIRNVAITDIKLRDLATGVHIHVENGPKYVKLADNTILKVE